MRLDKKISKQRLLRAFRVRNKLRGTSSRPRLSIHRSNKHVYAQVIDDVTGRTLASASTAEKSLCPAGTNGGNVAAAKTIGKAVAERAVQAGVKDVCFDRGQYRYHGRIAALADAAREAGLNF